MPKVGTAYVSIRAKLDKLDRDLQDGRRLTEKHARATQQSVSNIFRVTAAYFGIRELTQFGKELFETGKEVARLEKAFSEITGSAQAAGREFEFLRQTSDDLGQNFYDLADAYKGIAAASKGTALEGQKTRDIFVAIVKASASLELTADGTRGALNAISQMMSKGKVSAEELRQQLGERLPGAFNLMAEAMDVSTAELDKMLQSGEVMAADALPRLAEVLSNRYTGAIDDATRSSNKLNEAWRDFMKSLSTDFVPIVTAAQNALAGLLKGASDYLDGPSLQEQLLEAEMRLARLTGALRETSQQRADAWSESRVKIRPLFRLQREEIGTGQVSTAPPTEEESYIQRQIRETNELIARIKEQIELQKTAAKPPPSANSDGPVHPLSLVPSEAEIDRADAVYKQIKEGMGQFYQDHEEAMRIFLNDPYEKSIDDMEAWFDVMRDGADVFAATRTNAEKYSAEVERLTYLLEKGGIDQDTFNRAVDQAKDKYGELADATEDTYAAMADVASNFFDDLATGQLDDFEDYFRLFTGRLLAQWTDMISKMDFGKSGGGIDWGGMITSLFGSSSQSGGYVPSAYGMANGGTIYEPIYGVGKSGRRYAFGEGGVVEDVIPRGQGGGATSLTISPTIVLQALDARTGADYLKQQAPAIAAAVVDQMKHDPGYARFMRGR